MNKILLGSSSPRRIELLKSLNIAFDTYSPDIEEHFLHDPYETTLNIAIDKFDRCKSIFNNRYIIAADTVVYCRGKILGKPSNIYEAKDYLKLLSATKHKVITSVCMGYDPKCFTVITEVEFYSLDSELIDWYLNTKEWIDKAGSYAIQGFGKVFVKSISGDYFNVVGFPISLVWKRLLEDNVIFI